MLWGIIECDDCKGLGIYPSKMSGAFPAVFDEYFEGFKEVFFLTCKDLYGVIKYECFSMKSEKSPGPNPFIIYILFIFV